MGLPAKPSEGAVARGLGLGTCNRGQVQSRCSGRSKWAAPTRDGIGS